MNQKVLHIMSVCVCILALLGYRKQRSLNGMDIWHAYGNEELSTI
jgi:hypothetical protein